MKTAARIALITTFGLALIGIAGLFIDHYYYSWTSYLAPFGCDHKGFSGNALVTQEYDLLQLAARSNENPNYRSGYRMDFAERLAIERVFDTTKYTINFEKGKSRTGAVYTKVSFNLQRLDPPTSPDGKGKRRGPPPSYIDGRDNGKHGDASYAYVREFPKEGEDPRTPAYRVEKNLRQMIDEMPFSEAQKKEVREKIYGFGCIGHFEMPL